MKAQLYLNTLILCLVAGCGVFAPPTEDVKTATHRDGDSKAAVPIASASGQRTLTATGTDAPDENGLYAVQVVFLGDRSLSFVNKYEAPVPELFKPMLNKASTLADATFEFRYGLIHDNSDVVFEQFHFQPQELPVNKLNSKEDEKKDEDNVWVVKKSEAKSAPAAQPYHPSPNTGWAAFQGAINKRLAKSPSRNSDITNGVARALLSFREKPTGRKYLILATDFEDSYQSLPAIDDPSIQVYVVGFVGSQSRIEQVLKHPIRPYESLTGALSDIVNNL